MKSAVESALSKALLALGVEPPADMPVEAPRAEAHGDLSSPVAMGLARTLRKAPRQIAQDVVDRIERGDVFETVEVAGPGFINFTFRPAFLHSLMGTLLRDRGEFLRRDVGRGRRILIEYVSANPTGPLHLGHGRGAAVGNALTRLLRAAGFDVETEYYINDAGRQVRMLGESVFALYKGELGLEHPFPEEGYRGAYVADIARAALKDVGDRYRDAAYEGEAAEYFVRFSLDMMLEAIRENLEEFGIRFDHWQSERELYESGGVEHAMEFLKEKGMMYEQEGALWFRATAFGDEKDRVVVKSDGQPTYFASDIAYHLRKIERGYGELVNIWGADHHGYVPRLEAVIEALGYDRRQLRVLLVQMVALERAGKPVQMSKRAGEFVTLSEVAAEVGADIAKFIFLTRRHDSHLTFDLEHAKATSAENPVFYVQYANARIHSIFAHAREKGIDTEGLAGADLSPLSEPEEMALVKKLLSYPMTFESAALSHEPHHITFYLQELAGMFHPYYNKHRVVTDDPALSLARLALCEAVRLVLMEGLGTLGITAPERM